jgi:hypothetical protein
MNSASSTPDMNIVEFSRVMAAKKAAREASLLMTSSSVLSFFSSRLERDVLVEQNRQMSTNNRQG